ncbi:MAG: GHKL domain-containing protein [Christensenellaceae bacterium]|nr:GHKL domain-containing protein [Christensenellaceae bacterium]
MRNILARRILIITTSALLVFAITILIAIYTVSRAQAKDNAIILLKLIESSLIDTNTEIELTRFSDAVEGVRITIIDLEGNVISDTQRNDVSNFNNHLDRKEIREALNGEIGSEIRRSESFMEDFLYVAKRIRLSSESSIILRVAVSIKEINVYLYAFLLAASVIFIILSLALYFVSKPIADGFQKPFLLLKNRLEEAASKFEGESSYLPAPVTQYDDLNTALSDIETISLRLKDSLFNSREDKERLNFILENINQGILALSNDGSIKLCNETAKKYFNIQSSKLDDIGHYIKDSKIRDMISGAVSASTSTIFDLPSGGRIFDVRYIPTNLHDIVGILTATDVTSSRNLAKEKQEFFENASHELNTPLASILGYSEAMLLGGKYERKFLETIMRESSMMKSVINDMFIISELETGATTVDTRIDIKKSVEKIVEIYALKASAKNITIKASLATGIILADTDKISEVVSNLIDNAIKYNNEGGKVEIETYTKETKVIFSVKDNGIGIPEEYQSRIFERFFRVDKGRSKLEGGTGLGLAIVKHIVNRYAAELIVKSKLNEGTTITVLFNAV